jgi:phage shock protein PspC (stress-responsive transcriptional regulator)
VTVTRTVRTNNEITLTKENIMEDTKNSITAWFSRIGKNEDGTSKRMIRPADGRIFGGVCAGVADYLGVSRLLVRFLTVLSVFLPGPQVIAYIALWFLIPSERTAPVVQAVRVEYPAYQGPAFQGPTTIN